MLPIVAICYFNSGAGWTGDIVRVEGNWMEAAVVVRRDVLWKELMSSSGRPSLGSGF